MCPKFKRNFALLYALETQLASCINPDFRKPTSGRLTSISLTASEVGSMLPLTQSCV